MLRRFLLIVIAGVVLFSTGIYLARRWRIEAARSGVPSSLPAGVQQQTEGFAFSRSEGGRTVFSLEAARSEEREDGRIIVSGVTLWIFGRAGDRADRVRTDRCEYEPDGGDIQCPGEVDILLRSASSPDEEAPGLTITTRGLRYSPRRELVWSDSPVRISWEQGEGRAAGILYHLKNGVAELSGDVQLELHSQEGGPLTAEASRLLYLASTRRLFLSSPLTVNFQDGTLQAGSLEVELDEKFHTRAMEATGRVRMERRVKGERWRLEATGLVANYTTEGRLDRLDLTGPLEYSRTGPGTASAVHARQAQLVLTPEGELRKARIVGSARMTVERKGRVWLARGGWLEWTRRPGSGGDYLLRGGRAAGLELRPRRGERAGVSGERIRVSFRDDLPRDLQASGRTELWVEPAGGVRRTSTGEALRIDFAEDGALTAVEQRGNVILSVAGWRARGGRLLYDASGKILELREGASLENDRARTTAREIDFLETGGVLLARGEVRSTFKNASPGGNDSGEQGLRLAADELRAASDGSLVRYTGNVRLWSGEDRISAASLEYSRARDSWEASEEVILLLARPAGSSGGAIRVESEHLNYNPGQGLAVFDREVRLSSTYGTLFAPKLEVHFAEAEGGGMGKAERILATGGVLSELQGRSIQSDDVEYLPARGEIIFGGKPTVEDATGLSTSASRLTLFLADGTLLAESENGIRTVTRRPAGQ